MSCGCLKSCECDFAISMVVSESADEQQRKPQFRINNDLEESHGMKLFYEESKNKFNCDLELILSRNKIIPDIGQGYCSRCDPRYNLLISPEKNS